MDERNAQVYFSSDMDRLESTHARRFFLLEERPEPSVTGIDRTRSLRVSPKHQGVPRGEGRGPG